MRRLGLACVLAITTCASMANARPVGGAERTRVAVTASPVSRQELALAYQRFDREAAARLAGWAPERRAEISRSFDSLTMLFFAAKLDEARTKLNDLTASIVADEEETRTSIRALLDLRIAPIERWIPADAPRRITLRWFGEGPSPFTDAERRWSIEVRSVEGSATKNAASSFSAPLSDVIEFGPARPNESGTYEVFLHRHGLAYARSLGRVAVLPEPPSAIAKRLAQRTSEFAERKLGREGDRATFTSRLAILAAADNSEGEGAQAKSAQFLSDLPTLARELTEEAETIARGESPWKRRVGDHWRTIAAGAVNAPCRVYVPEGSVAAGAARPALVIALHGAGGDENMFFDGYGAGVIKRLADERGWVVVAPATTGFALTPIIFDGIVEEMRFVADVDPSRVFIVGHSMGAAAAGSITGIRGAKIAGTALVAGMGGGPKENSPPLMFVAGGLDPLFSAARLSASADGWRERVGSSGHVAFKVFPHDGHTLVMTAALPEIFAWFSSLPPRTDRRATDGTPESSPAP